MGRSRPATRRPGRSPRGSGRGAANATAKEEVASRARKSDRPSHEPYKRDLKTLEFHLLDAGHFALETNGDKIAKLMRDFLGKQAARK
jgi:hypothetical protein